MAESVADLYKFSELCSLFEQISSAKSQEKPNILSAFIQEYRVKGSQLKEQTPEAEDSFYPVLRLILPNLERERAPYGLKESTLSKRLVKILSLPTDSADSSRLAAFRKTGNTNIKDFADAAYWVLRKYYSTSKGLTIAELNNRLDTIAQCHSNSDPRGLDASLYSLLQDTSAEEQRWIIRIILKDVRLFIGQDRILKTYHPDAVDLYNINNSLSKVCATLKDASVLLHELEIEIFSPFRPMLSQRMDAKAFKKTVNEDRLFYIETKFDGERFQLHMQNGQFRYFSRNGYDYTPTYGNNFRTGLYTPLLKDVLSNNVTKIILDGEMMGWNKKTKKLGSKGMAFDVKKLTANSVHQPCFCVFDILVLNDKILTNKPLEERLQLLDAVLKPIEGTIVKSKYSTARTKNEIVKALNDSMDNEEEGIVFKDTQSVYKSNDRSAGWYKMKLEYFEGVMSDLDVVIIGGYYGEKRNWSDIDSFLLAVAVPPTSGGNPKTFHSFARISTGLSVEERKVINGKLREYWRKTDEGDPVGSGVMWSKEKPDVWIQPEKSLLLLVRGSELTRTKDFQAGYTLRFPRILQVRFDKPYYDCLTTAELLELTSSNKAVEKLNKRHLDVSDLDDPVKEKVPRYRLPVSEPAPVEEKTKILHGREFFVLTGVADWSKEEVENSIRENDGTVVKIERSSTLCVLVGDAHSRVQISKQQNVAYDLVKLSWLKRVLDCGRFSMYAPSDMLHTSDKTANQFLQKYDKYGDSFAEEATCESLKNALEMIEASGDYAHLTPSEMRELDVEMNHESPLEVYRGKVAYFDSYEVVNDMCSTEIYKSAEDEMKFRFLGGTASSVLNQRVDYVVVNYDMRSEREDIILANLVNVENDDATIIVNSVIAGEYESAKEKVHLLNAVTAQKALS